LPKPFFVLPITTAAAATAARDASSLRASGLLYPNENFCSQEMCTYFNLIVNNYLTKLKVIMRINLK
jgi:hypothetical protein